MISGVESTVDALRCAARSLTGVTTTPSAASATLQAAENAIMAQKALHFCELDQIREHEQLGFSSVATWGRAMHHLDSKTTRTFVRIGQLLNRLPLVREAAVAGVLTFEHLKSFDYAMRIVKVDPADEEALLITARELAADEFHSFLRRLHEAAPDELDKAWRDGMDKADVHLAKTLEGWHLSGFLPIDLGAKLKTVLDSAATPREAGDTRPPSQRRLEGLEALCDSVLEHGLPASNGIKPQLRIVIDLDDDQAHAKLAGFGPIGPALVAHLAREADWLTIKTRNHRVLDVGRRRRYATRKQTEAILWQQDGICDASGCRHPIAEIDHIHEWADGGRTDLANLHGYCRKCHTLKTSGKLKPRAG